MPRYHEIIMAYEGECQRCGGCCRGCHRLYTSGSDCLCRDHPDGKPAHCVMFPIGYAVELLPLTCSLRPTRTVRVDEANGLPWVRVSGRAGLCLAAPAPDPGSSSEAPTLHGLQGQLDAEHSKRIYRRTPERHIRDMAAVLEKLRVLEVENAGGPDAPLSWAAAAQAEKLLGELLTTALLYATRRDIIVGDLFGG